MIQVHMGEWSKRAWQYTYKDSSYNLYCMYSTIQLYIKYKSLTYQSHLRTEIQKQGDGQDRSHAIVNISVMSASDTNCTH